MFRQMLMTSAMRAVHAPENDEGGEDFQGEDDAGEFEDEAEGEQDDFDDGDAGDEGGEDGDGEPEPRQPTRGQTRHQALAAKAKAAEDRAAKLEADLAEERRQRNAPPQLSPEEAQRRREAHLATLTEAGRLEFLINEGRQQTTFELNQIRFSTWDAQDKLAFQAMCARNPTVAAMEDEVEQKLQEYRAGGQNVSRETAVKFLIGEKALAKVGRAKAAGRKREDQDRQRQGARPVNGRGDVAPNGSRRTSDREARRKRLEGASI